MRTLVAVSTYKKNKALREILRSLIENKYSVKADILICDDNNGEAGEVYEELKPFLPNLFYTTGPNRGIARNKNRGIKFFLENGYDRLLSMDDDIEMISPGILEAFEKAHKETGEHHINSFLGSYIDPIEKKGFFQVFPVKACSESKQVLWCEGVQGICCWYTREIVERLGYFNLFRYRYGYEHAAYSARAHRVQGTCPELFCMLANSPKYFKTQEVPNNYEIPGKEIDAQGVQYREIINKVYNGLDLKQTDHGLDTAKETVLK
jgi:GT2 family glycosyltransferase